MTMVYSTLTYCPVELKWPVRLWNHENMFETGQDRT